MRAGPTALRHIEQNGLKPADVRLIPGAAGGAKWLVLKELDRFVFEHWLPQSGEPLDLLGSSIGAWRFAAGMLGRSERLFELYLHQRYSKKPGREEITRVAKSIITQVLDDDGVARLLDHPRLRLGIMTARCRGPLGSEQPAVLGPALLVSALANMIRPQWQQLGFRRHLFYDPRMAVDWAQRPGWQLEGTALSRRNLPAALLASGSIPMVLQGVADIPDAPPGIYRDGGITDYHMPLDYSRAKGLVLFPHFSSTFKAGWFDKHLKWRRMRPALFNSVLLIHPSDEFIAALPHGKIPDRHDFANFSEAQRLRYWNRVVAESRRLVDEFSDWLDSGSPSDRVTPL